MSIINCANPNLNPFIPSPTKAWDKQRAVHLFRRTSFGANINIIKTMLNLDPVQVVNNIVDDAKALTLTAPPLWANWTLSNYSPIPDQRNTQIAGQIVEWGTMGRRYET
ncbi:MAG: hypothetical protein IPO92_09755 [Saprospiraceae bacterium]|nr:hypothetical protein [Saprospiraceae bacterium]